MVNGFNLTNIFPELHFRDSTNSFVPRLTFCIIFFGNSQIADENRFEHDPMGITILQQVILAIQSSPLQMLDKRQIWDIVQKMNPAHSNITSLRSMERIMIRSKEFEKVTNMHRGEEGTVQKVQGFTVAFFFDVLCMVTVGLTDGNLFRWRPNVQKRERYSRLHKGAKMDELLKDTARGHVILVENLKIKKVFSVNLLNH